MPRRRRRRSSDALAAQVLEAAAAEFEANGYAGATTAAIARRADVTETQLFRFFASKRDLFQAAVFDPLDRDFAAFNARHLGRAPSPSLSREEQVADYIGELHSFIETHWRRLMALVVASAFGARSGSDLGEIESLRDYFDRSAASMAQRLNGDAPVDPQLLVRVSFAAVVGNIILRGFLFPDRLAPEETVRAAVTRFVMHGISTDQPPANPAG